LFECPPRVMTEGKVVGGCADAPPQELRQHIVWSLKAIFDTPLAFLALAPRFDLWRSPSDVADAEYSLSTFTRSSQSPLVCLDARNSEEWKTHPWVSGSPGVGFFADLPLVVDGELVGSICVAHQQAQVGSSWESTRVEQLVGFADVVAWVISSYHRLAGGTLVESLPSFLVNSSSSDWGVRLCNTMAFDMFSAGKKLKPSFSAMVKLPTMPTGAHWNEGPTAASCLLATGQRGLCIVQPAECKVFRERLMCQEAKTSQDCLLFTTLVTKPLESAPQSCKAVERAVDMEGVRSMVQSGSCVLCFSSAVMLSASQFAEVFELCASLYRGVRFCDVVVENHWGVAASFCGSIVRLPTTVLCSGGKIVKTLPGCTAENFRSSLDLVFGGVPDLGKSPVLAAQARQLASLLTEEQSRCRRLVALLQQTAAHYHGSLSAVTEAIDVDREKMGRLSQQRAQNRTASRGTDQSGVSPRSDDSDETPRQSEEALVFDGPLKTGLMSVCKGCRVVICGANSGATLAEGMRHNSIDVAVVEMGTESFDRLGRNLVVLDLPDGLPKISQRERIAQVSDALPVGGVYGVVSSRQKLLQSIGQATEALGWRVSPPFQFTKTQSILLLKKGDKCDALLAKAMGI